MGMGQVIVTMDELLRLLGLPGGHTHTIRAIWDDTHTRQKAFAIMVEGPSMPDCKPGETPERVKLFPEPVPGTGVIVQNITDSEPAGGG